MQRELAFFERVKQRLRNREAYTDFLKCLNMFGEDIIGKLELVRCVCMYLPHWLAGRVLCPDARTRCHPSPTAAWCTTSSASTQT